MSDATVGRPRVPRYCWLAALVLAAAPIVIFAAQAPPPRGGAAAPAGAPGGQGAGSARAAAPVDLTGYWVSIVTEDWIERMAPDSPASGVIRGGRGGGRGGAAAAAAAGGGARGAVAAASADPCRVYGAAGSLRVPGRLNITWADDNTLKVEMDAGTQARLFHFNPTQPPPTQNTLQGYSVATWEAGGGGRGGRGGAAAAPRWGSLKVVTTNMTGGYLLSSRSNYSENAVLTEHFTRHSDFGQDYFTVTAVIEDGQMRATSSTFKKEPDGSKFKPAGCEIVR